jgi:hypothetical protein
MTTLSPEKQRVLEKLNSQAAADHREAEVKAANAGKPAPAQPVPLRPEQIEFPKWLHKDWAETEHAPGHHAPKDSKLAHNEDEAKALEVKGYSEGPPTLAKHEAHKGKAVSHSKE